MTSHDWFIERRTDFATRTLDPDDERLFADHLGRCDQCRAAVAQTSRELQWLPMAVEPVQPRPGFRWQVTTAVLGGRRRSRWIPAGLAAAALVFVGLAREVIHGRSRVHDLEATIARSDRSLAAIGDTLAVLRRAAKVLDASIEMEGRRGGLLIFADSVTHRWNVVLHGVPRAPNGQAYQFWFICNDGMVRSIELSPPVDGTVLVTLGMPVRGGGVLGAALSLEPVGGSGDQPRGRQLAHLML